MDRNEAFKKLRDCVKDGDAERAHKEADKILCELLKSLGYEDVVELWENVDKWYA